MEREEEWMGEMDGDIVGVVDSWFGTVGLHRISFLCGALGMSAWRWDGLGWFWEF